ncbi:MAG TPA: CRISPR-associated protein Cas4, partial [Isosphaeraceae bacterium]|nr:CRISPR-associated protein Cas4 [Isosphaeraceae bacterium]
MNSHENYPLRVMSLHALAYCHRLFYLEEVEEIRVADDRVYAGRELHSSLEADEEGEQTQLELADPELGLVGKVDAIRRRDGSLLPYEHKRGRCQKEGKTAAAWSSDRLQVIAYAALIQSVTGQPVAEGRIRYHADNTTVRVPFDDAARQELTGAIATARRLRESTERPPVAENERLCVHCSLAPVCLPEEVRQAEHPEREPLRLFPPDRDGTSLHVIKPGAHVGRSGESLVVHSPDDTPDVKRPVRELEALLLHGPAQISTQALNLCSEHDVAVHWLTTSGRHIASLTSTAGQVQRRLRQYRALADEATCLRLA